MAAVWASYRADCRPFATGCRQCGKDIPDRNAYCSHVCKAAFESNHFWNTAAARAIALACPGGETFARNDRGLWMRQGPICRRCEKTCGTLKTNGRREAEVNHKVPLNGERPSFGCCHHQGNLEVVCHDCHVVIGIEQRRDGRQRRRGGLQPPGERLSFEDNERLAG